MGCHQEAEKENAGGEISKMPEIYNINYTKLTTMKIIFYGFIHCFELIKTVVFYRKMD